MIFMTNIPSLLTTFFVCACAFVVVRADPILESRSALDIFSPPILYPNAATVWFAGQSHNVTWDPSNPPKSISNLASIVLRTAGASDWTELTLASNFSLLDGRHEIKVPTNVTSRDDWEIILFGDSGNVSPAFTILK